MKAVSPSKSSSIGNPERKLKIIIRIRPTLNEEDSCNFIDLEDNNTLQIRRPGNFTSMKFNNILPPKSKQQDVYQLVEDSVLQFMEGVNTTIFAYGQTGAGKTYSIIGNYSPNESQENLYHFLSSKERGVLSRSLETIMSQMEQLSIPCRLFVSFFEIYNEKIYDLYNNTLVSLDIRQSKLGQISIPGLVSIDVTKMEEAIHFLMIGLKNRATGSTHANAKSSRSHSVFQIGLDRYHPDGSISTSSLRIVDLAGSQKFKIPTDLSNAEKEVRIQELTSINGSLSCLGHCISALIERSRTHIPFRNSKLTRILSDSLLGLGKMRFIICISPSVSASAQTFSTLQFANRAKKAIFQRTEQKTPPMSKKKSETEQVLLLKKELQKEREQKMLLEKEMVNTKRQYSLMKNENEKLQLKLRQKMSCMDKSRSSHASQVKYKNGKENGFKEEILRLPIFQKNSGRAFELFSGNKSNGQKENRAQPKHNHVMSRKKIEFEKKIKKFIEKDSENHHTDSHSQQPKYPLKTMPNQPQYSFENSNPLQANVSGEDYHVSEFSKHGDFMKIGNYENLWRKNDNRSHNSQMEQGQITQEEDTNQFIEKTCNGMQQFHELKEQMERAKLQLSNLRKKDMEIQTRNSHIR